MNLVNFKFKKQSPDSTATESVDDHQSESSSREGNVVHVRVYQRNGRKCITYIEGIKQPEKLLKRIAKDLRKKYQCGATVIEHEKHGTCITMSGDKREEVKEYLLGMGVVSGRDVIKIHGH